MKGKTIMTRTHGSTNRTTKNYYKAADLLKQKKKLKDEVRNLQNIIMQAEQNLDIAKFGAVTNTQELVQSSVERRTYGKVPNLFALFCKEIYKYAGFYCVKLTKVEYIFNFISLNKIGSYETFSVQIYNNDSEATMGNWVMPMSTDINKILSETPITNLATVILFLRNCKRHIDCYTKRKNEFHELMEEISDMSNIEINANIGFIMITLQLLGVYNKTKDSFVNLTIYLSYKSDETRPSIISVDWNLNKNPSLIEANWMKSYTKFFKNQSLVESFKRMRDTTHPIFTWAAEKYVAVALELDYSNESEDESILIKANDTRKRLATKRQSNRDLKERWKKRNKQTSVVSHRKSCTVNENVTQLDDPTVQFNIASLHQKSTKNLKLLHSLESIPTKLVPQNIIQRLMKKKKHGLRQTTLSFRRNQVKEFPNVEVKNIVDVNAEKSFEVQGPKPTNVRAKRVAVTKELKLVDSKEKEIGQTTANKLVHPVGILSAKKTSTNKVNLAMTSTPLQRTTKSRVKFVPMNDAELSPIESANSNVK